MKLVRNTTSDGSCKYALLRIDKMLKDGEFTFIQDFLEKYPELKEYIEFGQPHSEEEFFVIKLKDINSTRALTAYVLEADKTDPEFALEVMDLALRSGKRHNSCKQPDLLEDSDISETITPTIVDYPYSPITSIILEPPQFPRSELNSESLDFPKQNEELYKIHSSLLEEEHKCKNLINGTPNPPPPEPPKKPECQKSFYTTMPTEEELVRLGIKIREPGFFKGMYLSIMSLFK